MSDSTATLTILCNPPKRYGKSTNIMIGIDDLKLADALSNETVTITVPLGLNHIQVIVRNAGTDCMTGITPVEVHGNMNLRIKYGVLGKGAKLVLDK